MANLIKYKARNANTNFENPLKLPPGVPMDLIQ